MNTNSKISDVRNTLKAIGCAEERHGSIFRISRLGRALWIKQRDGLLFERGLDPLDDTPYWKRTSADEIVEYFKAEH